MTTTVYTFAELDAMTILRQAGQLSGDATPREAADRILQLAERIKSERASTTMQLAAEAAGGTR